MMTRKQRNAIVAGIVVAGIGMFAFFQVETAKNLRVEMADSTVIEKSAAETAYDLSLSFENPSALPLAVGDTKYVITINDEKVGEGVIETFTLSPFGKETMKSRFVADTSLVEKYRSSFEDETSRLDGVSTYDLPLLSFAVPFGTEPSPQQIQQFFNQ